MKTISKVGIIGSGKMGSNIFNYLIHNRFKLATKQKRFKLS